ncbi:MAG: tetratricopeptide repeat protein [Anaerolineae bacterium]|nr:tetratricopeptide repeat protein [Anaerolineae bacterium]
MQDINPNQSQIGIIGDHAHVEGGIHFHTIAPPANPTEARNRTAMLQLVHNTWINGYLEQSLHGAAPLELGKNFCPDAIERPWDRVIQMPEQPNRAVPTGTSMLDLFDQMSGSLLILGDPGSGKTLTLLELARDAIARAQTDPTCPIPVIFNLASWATRQQELTEWLVDELRGKYLVARKLARDWVKNDILLLLLDGLDEVRADRREACVVAINAFRREHGFVPLVVCCRSDDYAMLSTRLQLQGAVALQPFSPAQTNAYLNGAGNELDALRAILAHDADMQELARSPLMLNIMTMAYRGVEMNAATSPESPEAQRERLLDAYVRRMFARRGQAQPYSPEQTERGLAWLAQQLTAHNQAVFLLENVQPDWLPERDARRACRAAWWAGGLLLAGWSMLVGRMLGLLFPLLAGGLVMGLLGGLFGGLLGEPGTSVQVVDRLDWSWRRAARGLPLGFLAGLGVGLGIGAAAAPTIYRPDRLGLLVLLGLLFALFGGLVGGLAGGLGRAAVATRTVPNQGIRQTTHYALLYALAVAPTAGLAAAASFRLAVGQNWTSVWWLESLIIGLLLGLGARHLFGGQSVLLHYALHGALWREGYLPWAWIRFFDYAAGRILLRKVGGGYLFVHRLLQEHLAARALPLPPPFSLARALRALPRRRKVIFFLSGVGALILVAGLAFLAGRDLVRDACGLAGLGYAYLGTNHIYRSDYSAAVAAYSRAIELNGRDIVAYGGRGAARYRLGEYALAVVDFDRVLDLDPGNAIVYNNRGYAYNNLGEYRRALTDLDHALELDPEFAIAYNGRGRTYVKLGEYERALADLNRALELDPQYASACDNLAHVYALQNQPDDACAWLEKAIALDAEYRDLARTEADFDPVRNAACFQSLLQGE